MQHTIEIIDDLMCLMDEDGNGVDGHLLVGLRDAKRQIQTWAAEYTIDIAEAYRRVSEYFAACR